MDLVRGIFKQKIAAFLVFFEVFPEYIQKPCPPRLKITAQVQSLQVILEKGEGGWGRVFARAPNVKGRREA